MSITILHGEQVVGSRSALTQLLEAAKKNAVSVRRLEGKSLDLFSLEETLGTQDLFAPKSLIVIEELFSIPKGKRKDDLLALLKQTSAEVVLWEKKLLTATQLKQLPTAKVQLFKASSKVFSWIDSLAPQRFAVMIQKFREAELQDGAELCFAMLSRQIRLLLQVKDGEELKLAPFAVAKLNKQAQLFSLPKLLQIHRAILRIDEEEKTSSSPFTLSEKIVNMLLGRVLL